MKISIFPHAGILLAIVATSGSSSTARAVEFKKDILPIFETKCFKCHGNGKSKAGVGLDEDKIAREIGDVIIPGDLEKSDLYQSIVAEKKDDLMPPPGKGRPLSDSEIDTIRQWIVAGAPIEGVDPMPVAEAEPGKPAPITGDWTNTEGRTITATLLRVEGDTAILQMAGGKIYNYPIASLSTESQERVREFAAAAAE